jgi:fatty acid desaturase
VELAVRMPTDEAAPQFTATRLSRAELAPLLARANGPGLARAVWHLGFLAVTVALILELAATLWVLPLIVLHGYALAFLFCPFHEAAHRTAFRSRPLNFALGTITGLLTCWPLENYRVFHWEHHRHTQQPGRDPELHFPKPRSLGAYLVVLTGIPNLQRRLGDLLRLAGGRADRPWMAPAAGRYLIWEARAYLAVYVVVAAASVAAGSPAALLVWIAPWMIGQAFLRPYLLAEHTGCDEGPDCLSNTRTTLTLAWVRLFAWNMPYHAEHHAYPGVPFHALPRLHARVRDKLANVEPGYLAATATVNRHLFGSARRT